MTLRLLFRPQQPLFALFLSLVLATAGYAQAPAVATPDTIVTQDGKMQAGKIMGATPTGVQVQIGQGVITLPMASIKEVRMAVLPPEWAQAQAAFAAKNYDAALNALRALDKYRGLPAEWAQQAVAMAGDIWIEKNDLVKAEAAYKDFQKLYPAGQGSVSSEIGLARLAVAKKDLDTAKAKLEPILAKAGEDKNVSRNAGLAYGQAYFVMGQIKEAEGDANAALENYLKTVGVYYFDKSTVALALDKADALRKAHPDIFVP